MSNSPAHHICFYETDTEDYTPQTVLRKRTIIINKQDVDVVLRFLKGRPMRRLPEKGSFFFIPILYTGEWDIFFDVIKTKNKKTKIINAVKNIIEEATNGRFVIRGRKDAKG